MGNLYAPFRSKRWLNLVRKIAREANCSIRKVLIVVKTIIRVSAAIEDGRTYTNGHFAWTPVNKSSISSSNGMLLTSIYWIRAKCFQEDIRVKTAT